MRVGRLSLILIGAAILWAAPAASKADNGSYSYSSGSFTTGTVTGSNIAVAGATMSVSGATLSFSCPITSFGSGTYALTWTCAGGAITIASPNNAIVFHGKFDEGSMTFSGSGGGRGGHVTYYYSFFGSFSGTVKTGSISQAANGSLSQYVKTGSQIGRGSAPVTSGGFGWGSAYSPLLVADNANSRIVEADSITGADLSTFGKYGTGTAQFETIGGLSQDAAGHIYATDSTLDRLIRVDSISGQNWLELGGQGMGTRHFNTPRGVTIDATGKIWVADSGNNRIVRMDDMTGANWTAFGALGTGDDQFSGPTSIAFDTLGRIYVADAGNNRLVRFDDLTGKNWTVLSEVLIDPYGYPFYSPQSVAVDQANRIYVAAGTYLIRTDDMTGANPQVSVWSNALNSISLDKSGTIYVASQYSPGLAQVNDAAGGGYFASGLGGAVSLPSAVFAGATTTPPPAVAVLSTQSLTYVNRNVGEPSPPRYVVLTNLGAAAMTIDSITSSADFPLTKSCSTQLSGGAHCTISVRFDPTTTGRRTANLTVTTNAVRPLLEASLAGKGTAPTAVVLPANLTFDAQQTGTSSGTQIVTLTNTGSGPLTISSIQATGSFSQSNNCGKTLLPASGCTIGIVFQPTATGSLNGALTISDDVVPSGTQQTVALTGTGTAAAPSFSLSPESIQFAAQQVTTTSAPQTVTLTNHATAAISLAPATYSVGFKGSSTCGSKLSSGAKCTFKIQFAPTAPGPTTGLLTIPSSGQTVFTVALSGTGTGSGAVPVLVATPPVVDFGQLVVGDNPSMNATIKNSSGLPTEIRSVSLAGPSDFSVTGNSCSGVLAGGASCTVQFTVIPTVANGTETATFTITEGTGATTRITVTAQVTTGN